MVMAFRASLLRVFGISPAHCATRAVVSAPQRQKRSPLDDGLQLPASQTRHEAPGVLGIGQVLLAKLRDHVPFALMNFKSNAEAERLGRSWLPHALGAAVAAAQGLVLWVGFHQPVDGAECAALSLVIAEAQIFTQPMRAMDDLAEYQRQFSRPNQSALRWHLAPAPRGLGLLLQW